MERRSIVKKKGIITLARKNCVFERKRIAKKKSSTAGFEPARAKPNRFQVCLLNHSDISTDFVEILTWFTVNSPKTYVTSPSY
jgi:hypothetical protein